MKKKILAAILAAAMTIALTACGGAGQGKEEVEITWAGPIELCERDGTILHSRAALEVIEIGMERIEAEKLLGKLLDDSLGFEYPGVVVHYTIKGTDLVERWLRGEITEEEMDMLNVIGSITITDRTYMTARGVRIGDSVEKVRKAYGEPSSYDSPNPDLKSTARFQYFTYYGDRSAGNDLTLWFTFDETGTVTDIHISIFID